MTEANHLVELDAAIAAASGGRGADGVHWTLERAGDLNANLVHLEPGHAIDEHVNDAVDVLVVVVAGAGTLTIAGSDQPLAPHAVVDVPKGTARRVRAGESGLWYLTVHVRRRGLHIDTARS